VFARIFKGNNGLLSLRDQIRDQKGEDVREGIIVFLVPLLYVGVNLFSWIIVFATSRVVFLKRGDGNSGRAE
jgi:hypothetical protein